MKTTKKNICQGSGQPVRTVVPAPGATTIEGAGCFCLTCGKSVWVKSMTDSPLGPKVAMRHENKEN